jgi:hypothetical protein
MAATLNLAIWGGAAGLVVAVLLSFVTEPHPKEKLAGLVYEYRIQTKQSGSPWYQTPEALAASVAVLFIALNVVFR